MGLFDIFTKKFESIFPAAAKLLQDNGAVLIDVRESQEHKTHAPGAKLISLGDLERRLKEIPIEREILVICQSGMRSSQAAGILSKNGYQAKDAENQAGYVGNNIFTGKTESVQFGDLAEKMSEGALLVDVRSEFEHVGGSIPGSVLIPIDTLRENLDQLAGKDVVVHCGVGQRGHTAVQLFQGHGVNAKNLDGGYTTWKQGMDARDRAAKS